MEAGCTLSAWYKRWCKKKSEGTTIAADRPTGQTAALVRGVAAVVVGARRLGAGARILRHGVDALPRHGEGTAVDARVHHAGDRHQLAATIPGIGGDDALGATNDCRVKRGFALVYQ